MLVDKMAQTLGKTFAAKTGDTVVNEVAKKTTRGAAEVMGRDALSVAGQKALGPNAGVTPEMMKAIEQMLDPKGTGVITKAQGFVELAEPAGKDGKLFSNYYDEKFQHGDHVKPLPTGKVTELMSQGYTLRIRAVKGDVAGISTAMSKDEIAKLTDDVTAILLKSPLTKKSGILGLGHSLPVHETIIPHYLFRKPVNRVVDWSAGDIEKAIKAGLTEKERGIKIDPMGQHADGPFVLDVWSNPAF